MGDGIVFLSEFVLVAFAFRFRFTADIEKYFIV